MTLSETDLRLARIFAQIAEAGGLVAAEAHLGIGLSTLSRQLQAFEARLGMVLCRRGRGGFALTPEGEEVLAHVQTLLRAREDFATHLAGMGAALGGRLKIGMIDCSAGDPDNPLRHVLARVQRARPEAGFEIVIGAPRDLERQVLEDRLHLAAFPEYWVHDGLDYLPLYHERVGLFAAPGHPATLAPKREAVERHGLVHRALPEPPDLARRKAAFPVAARAEATEAVLALVLSGVALGFLPAHLGRSHALVEILPEVFAYSLPMCLIHRRDRPPSRLHRLFLTAAAEAGLKPAAAG